MRIEKLYRPNVAAIILSSKYPQKCEFFLAHRNDIKNIWQFPQGGIDANETPREALYRELEEEIGCADIEIISEYPSWITYDFPKVNATRKYPFDGQKQKYFLVRLKDDEAIDLYSHATPEFEEYKFVAYDELMNMASYLKRQVYKKVIDYFIQEGFISQ